MTWQTRFDRLLKAMSQGEPHKAEKRKLERPINEAEFRTAKRAEVKNSHDRHDNAVNPQETVQKPNEG